MLNVSVIKIHRFKNCLDAQSLIWATQRLNYYPHELWGVFKKIFIWASKCFRNNPSTSGRRNVLCKILCTMILVPRTWLSDETQNCCTDADTLTIYHLTSLRWLIISAVFSPRKIKRWLSQLIFHFTLIACQIYPSLWPREINITIIQQRGHQ